MGEAMEGGGAFVMEMIGCQRRLYAYILSVVLDREIAQEILQNTNLVLLQKKNEYQPGTNFGAWACKVAFFEILSDRRKKSRSRHIFDDDLLQTISERAAHASQDADVRIEALESCLEKLPTNQRDLLRDRYAPGASVEELASERGKSPAALSCLLYRIRSVLVECIERKLERAS